MLMYIFEPGGILLLIAAGVLVGARCNRLPRLWWLIGFAIPIIIIRELHRVRSFEMVLRLLTHDIAYGRGVKV